MNNSIKAIEKGLKTKFNSVLFFISNYPKNM